MTDQEHDTRMRRMDVEYGARVLAFAANSYASVKRYREEGFTPHLQGLALGQAVRWADDALDAGVDAGDIRMMIRAVGLVPGPRFDSVYYFNRAPSPVEVTP